MNLVDRISFVKDKIDTALTQCDRSDSVTIVAATKTQDSASPKVPKTETPTTIITSPNNSAILLIRKTFVFDKKSAIFIKMNQIS